MITEDALRQALEGAQKEEDEGPCFCTDADCEWPHAEEDEQPASHISTFVTPDGQLDRKLNKYYLGPDFGLDGELETVVDPALWPDDDVNVVVIERATGAWAPLSAYQE